MADDSLTEAVFFHPKRSHTAPTPATFPRLQGEVNDGPARQRERAFEATWRSIHEPVLKLITDQHSSTFEAIAQFGIEYTQTAASSRPFKEVPAALLLSGFNMPDHDKLFASLAGHLTTKLSPYVIELEAKDCASVRDIMRHLIGTVTELHDIGRVPLSTLEILGVWYNESLRLRKSDSRPPITIIIKDFEAASAHAVGEFIELCSNNSGNPPIFLVFGISSSASVVHR